MCGCVIYPISATLEETEGKCAQGDKDTTLEAHTGLTGMLGYSDELLSFLQTKLQRERLGLTIFLAN